MDELAASQALKEIAGEDKWTEKDGYAMSSSNEIENTEHGTRLSRRDFLKGSVAAGAAALGGAALAGCSSKSDAAATATVDLPDAQPIAPVDPPAKWDKEADFVVVGTGGGGLTASVLARDKGASVITVEKNSFWGGATQHACSFMVGGGGTKAQDAAKFALPSFPYDPVAFVKMVMPAYQFSADIDLLLRFATDGPKCADWMIDHGAPLVAVGPRLMPKAVAEGKQNLILGQKPITDAMYKVAVDEGAQFIFNTAVTALVKDGDRIVGVKVKENKADKELYIHAKKAVILCAGGFGMNKDMLTKYCPTALNAVIGGPMPWHTGEVTRMGIGAGADLAGHDSWNCWEAEPDDGASGWNWHYFWSGSTQLCRQPWLQIDKNGKRYPFYSLASKNGCPSLVGGGGEQIQAMETMAQIGHRGYCIFDADYDANVLKLGMGADRVPTRPTHPISADAIAQGMAPQDYQEGVKAALKRGAIKKSDTIEGLAKELGLDPAVLTKAVEDWNAVCAAGQDTLSVYPYDPKWLIPIVKAPFYGAKIGGAIGKIMTGLRVNSELQVLNTEGRVIPGLYANFTTAGGITGESSFGGNFVASSMFGGASLSYTSGYLAMTSALENNA